jgi:hypothetical protein
MVSQHSRRISLRTGSVPGCRGCRGWMAGKAGNTGFFGLTRLGDRSQVLIAKEGRKERLLPFDRLSCRWHLGRVPVPRHTHKGGC